MSLDLEYFLHPSLHSLTSMSKLCTLYPHYPLYRSSTSKLAAPLSIPATLYPLYPAPSTLQLVPSTLQPLLPSIFSRQYSTLHPIPSLLSQEVTSEVVVSH
jgi:hypothetical protein